VIGGPEFFVLSLDVQLSVMMRRFVDVVEGESGFEQVQRGIKQDYRSPVGMLFSERPVNSEVPHGSRDVLSTLWH
jgi:hypothetical protein